ncbi:hypothetical protein BJY01DRAFT_254275 [Aspergillus pseudoustus]|uniref:Nucleotidyltransferase n=1 Tax=Aspergillus pseudoustus TaxID=1810923 RepID=A0ABR4IU87_9EURO
MTERKEFRDLKDFEHGLVALDAEMGHNPWLTAFAPIRFVTAGGFLALSYVKCRDTMGDLDYLIDPEFVGDRDIQQALHGAIRFAAHHLKYNDDWANEAMAVEENLEILAAPIEWALERKLRRIYTGNRGRKAELDMADAVALLRHLRERNSGPLDAEFIRTMNLNGFVVVPGHSIMQQVDERIVAKSSGVRENIATSKIGAFPAILEYQIPLFI